MTCPACADTFDPGVIVRGVTVCPTCRRSLLIEADTAGLATAADTMSLSQAELATLKAARNRPKRTKPGMVG